MINTIIRYIGVICAALVIGYYFGMSQGNSQNRVSVSQNTTNTNEVEKSTTVTETTERRDGSKVTRTTTDTTRTVKKEENKQATVPQKEKPRQLRTTVAIRPEWNKEKKEIKGHPVVSFGKRLWDSPAWADIILDIDRKEVAVGLSLEW